jgi:hypothetical protein
MNTRLSVAARLAVAAPWCPLHPVRDSVADADILVDGVLNHVTRTRCHGPVEACKGKEYAIRLHNPLRRSCGRGAVGDALNTIDPRDDGSRRT